MSREQNRLLDALPSDQRDTLKENCELVSLQGEQQLWEQGEELTTAYMPRNAVISLLQTMSDGLSVEVASVGNEGVVGVPLLLGTRRSITRAVCQVPGEC